MFRLKAYQEDVLKSLEYYFNLSNQYGNADTAFYEATQRSFGRGIPYNPVKELPGLPYVCLRVPTGGGKTLIACYSVSIAKDELLHADNSVVLWLVPSNAIKEQTIKALKDDKHPYRQALNSNLGSVEIFDISEALSLKPATVNTETVIIVSTIQAFRVEDTEGRKVYEPNGSLMDHFSRIPDETLSKMDRYEDGKPKPTLANILCLYRPIVIVDEAHNARTSLSFETLKRFNPSCIIEFTATPAMEDDNSSNVLHSVSAAELYADKMIKMPIHLQTRNNWKELLSDSIRCLENLTEIATKERYETEEYIRPIMLIQAQPQSKNKETLTYEVVKKCLMEDFNLNEDEIAISTGGVNDLEDIDILDKTCKYRFIITVQKLKEGWDCPFAYILCTLATMRSTTAVEQIIGRILRLPNVKRKVNKELNGAYAFSVGGDSDFGSILNNLQDTLVKNGFDRQEARDFISYTPTKQEEFDMDQIDWFNFKVSVHVEETPKLEKLPKAIETKINFDNSDNTFTFKGVMTTDERDKIKKCFTTEKDKLTIERVYRKSNKLPDVDLRTPSEKGEKFSVPVLAVKQGNFLEEFEEQHFLEYEWELAKCDYTLPKYSGKSSQKHIGEIYIDEKEGKLKTRFIDKLQDEMAFLFPKTSWTVAHLVNWLDRKIKHPDINPMETGIYLTHVIQALIDNGTFTLEQLVYDKYNLLRKIEQRIDFHRKISHKKIYNELLFGAQSPVTVTPETCFSYNSDPFSYPCNTRYTGRYEFNKHYYPYVGDLKDSGEEFECAQFIDSGLSKVNFWVRNLERKPGHSFWLQTSTDKFYPDFVCKLQDKRFLVVEYKGDDRWSNDDSKEKRNLGELWAERSDGRCLFIMPKGKDFDAIKRVVE